MKPPPAALALAVLAATNLAAAPAARGDDPPAPAPAQPPAAITAPLPKGVTILVPLPPGRENWPVIRLGPPASDPAAAAPAPAVAVAPVGGAPLATAAPAPAQTTIGPAPNEQQKAFGRPAVGAGQEPWNRTTWEPTNAYPPRADGSAYPWNPARFAPLSPAATWTPTAAWGTPQPEPEWRRVHWSKSTRDNTWTPTDAWGRTLATPPKKTDATVPPEPAPPPVPATPAARTP